MESKQQCIEVKAIFVGDSFTGKTTLFNALLSEELQPTKPNVCSQYSRLLIDDNDPPLSLDLWDTAGQERYAKMLDIYFRGAQIALICCGADNHNSFENVKSKWIGKMYDIDETPLFALVYTKNDIQNGYLEDARKYAEEEKIPFLSVSSITSNGLLYLRKFLIQSANQVLSSCKAEPTPKPDSPKPSKNPFRELKCKLF